MPHTKSEAGKRRHDAQRVRPGDLVEEPAVKKPKRCKPEDIRCVKFNRMLKTEDGKTAALIKNVFSSTEMDQLARFLLEGENATAWKVHKDKTRGPKPFFITGKWIMQGNAVPGAKIHPAGKAGKRAPEICARTHTFLLPFAERTAAVLRKRRPDIVGILDALPPKARSIGDFPLFMAVQGVARMHKDTNDLVSVLFLIKSEGKGGELEIGGTRTCFDWKVGDAIILDSSKLYHGTREFTGKPLDRIVGLFIIHKSILRVCGLIE